MARMQDRSFSPRPDFAKTQGRIPLWIKILYTLFLAVLIPVYWVNYGPSNFLYFCDVALFLTLYAIWSESRLAASMAAVGILVPQAFWCADFVVQIVRLATGNAAAGMTAYMFDGDRSGFLRGLSLFHGWLPFLLVFLVARLGFHRAAWKAWTAVAWGLCLFSFFCLPASGSQGAHSNAVVNVNYVHGFSDTQPQQWMPPELYLLVWMLALLALAYLPTHLLLNRLFGKTSPR
jgi:hypothetical protein